jgi:hypothetical protein
MEMVGCGDLCWNPKSTRWPGRGRSDWAVPGCKLNAKIMEIIKTSNFAESTKDLSPVEDGDEASRSHDSFQDCNHHV